MRGAARIIEAGKGPAGELVLDPGPIRGANGPAAVLFAAFAPPLRA